ncbi:MAG: response regulator [Candidatus Hydrogenedentales bacterium]|jgi:two-component system sensor histidine kinase/response regulator
MNCDFCSVRSSVGYCGECKRLLCDDCGEKCENCGALACREHIRETAYRRLCAACMRERNQQFASSIDEMQRYAYEMANQSEGRAGQFFERLIDVLEEVRRRDRDLQDAQAQLEQRIVQRTQNLQRQLQEKDTTCRSAIAMKEAALEATRAKSEFLTNTSHEFRTPMNGVIALTDLLLETELTATQRHYVETIQRSGRALMSLVGDILDYARIEAGRLTITPIPFDLEVTITDVVELLVPRAEEKGLALIMRYAPNAPRRLIGDAGRVRQILTNLIGNAIKFTHQGHVLVNAECLGLDEERAILRIAVEDTGIGIPQSRLNGVFRQFVQADDATYQYYGGTGLGLPIAHKLSHMMGGRIGVKSTVGEGSRFRVTLPFALDREAAVAPPDDATDLHGLPVLLADPSQMNRRILHEQLSSWGLHVETVSNPEKVLTGMRNVARKGTPFQLTLITHQPDAMDALVLAESIQADPQLRGTVLVMLSRTGLRGEAVAAAEAGFTAYLSGVFRSSEFHDMLRAAWSAHENKLDTGLITRHTIAEAREKSTDEELSAKPYINANILVVDDEPVNQEVAREVLKTLGCRVTVASNGQEGLECYRQDQFDAVLMDCEMPVLDGYAATRAIREWEGKAAHVPIIAMTGHASELEQKKSIAAGMDAHFVKPVEPAMLMELLMRWLHKQPAGVPEESTMDDLTRESTENESTAPAPQSIDDTIPVLDTERAAEITGGNVNILKRVTGVFLESLPPQVEALAAALTGGQRETVQHKAHALKSAAASIGGLRVNRIALELEAAAKEDRLAGVSAHYANELVAEFARLKAALEAVDWEKEVPPSA